MELKRIVAPVIGAIQMFDKLLTEALYEQEFLQMQCPRF